MAEGKKGFLLYADYQELFEELSDEDAGQLVKHIFKYVNDKDPETENKMVKISFIPIKRQLKRDLDKYEETKAVRSKAGKASAAAKKLKKEQDSTTSSDDQQTPTKSTHVNTIQQTPTKSTDKDNVNDTVNDIDKVRDINVLNAFKENVIKECEDLGFDESIYIPFMEHWTERDFESKCYAWQVPETFIIKSRLKGWKKNHDKDNPKEQKNSISESDLWIK